MNISQNLLRLASNPNIIRLESLQTMAGKSDGSRQSLEYVLGEEMVKTIADAEIPVPLESIGYVDTNKIKKEVNTIFVWGQPKSGKTSFVSSLLASADYVKYYGEPELKERSQRMAEMFSETDGGYKVVNTGNSSEVEVTLAEITQRVGFFNKRYPQVFVEVQMADDSGVSTFVNSYLRNAQEQIHVFCVDCSADIDVQAKKILHVLDYLNRTGRIARTNGVYILVTKSDMMYRVPREYREQAAQTLITAGQRELWQMVRNICYDKGIYGATPLVFTIGDVKFQQMVSIDLTAARRVLMTPILQKSQPRLTWFVRMLRMFNGKVTAALFSFLFVLATWGIFSLISIDGSVPEGKNLPYDYQKEFLARVDNEIKGKSYSESHNVYEELLKDINHEKNIMTADSVMLLDSSVVYTCDSALMNTFADIVHEAVVNELGGSSWNKVLLSDCKNYCHSMTQSGVLGKDMSYKLKEDYETIYTFFNKVEPIYTKHARECSSLDDIKNVAEEVKSYNIQPYTNNDVTRQGLHNAVGIALKSCASKLKTEASSIAREYRVVKNQLDDLYYSLDFFSSRKNSLEKQMDNLEKRARALRARISAFADYANDQGASDANGILSEAKRIINDI